jgi:CDP-glucose 4,6-dehydratase
VETVVTPNVWRGRRVLITGHTGFKGSWLALWLSELGAEVTGFALAPPTTPSLFETANIAKNVNHILGDVRDLDAVRSAVAKAQPEVVFHLAAQPIVRYSYQEPVETYATNVMGTVHVLEACRQVAGLRAIVAVTSDKCYENREWIWPYRENDPMGGYDPYSSSKGAAELVISAYRRSFFSFGAGVASVRAGNVIGGGDWAADRLIPDLVRAFEAGRRPDIRSPQSVRPWQHVLEALGGYLMIAERLLGGDASAATGWNFGPSDDDAKPVSWIVENMLTKWGEGAPDGWDRPVGEQPHEAHLLRLDCSKARTELGWRPVLSLDDALRLVVEWHRAVHAGGDARQISLAQLAQYRQSLCESVPEFTA